MILQPVVEGQGEVEAVPVLLRRLRDEADAWALEVARPHRRRRTELVQRDTLYRAVQVAALRESCAAILVLFDADDDCPKELAPTLQGWAQEAAGAIPCAVVMANREYEAWFLAGIEGLRKSANLLEDATSPADPEAPRNAKGMLESKMPRGRSYSPTVDQVMWTAHMDLEQAYRRCRSFRKLVGAFGKLAASGGVAMTAWPPPAWVS